MFINIETLRFVQNLNNQIIFNNVDNSVPYNLLWFGKWSGILKFLFIGYRIWWQTLLPIDFEPLKT